MKALIKKINRILKDRSTRRLLTRIVSVSAALVVFVTTYALVLPAITMEAEAQCGIEAHQHDDSCYEDVLVCGQEESEGHTHDESCYSISQELICEIPEHQHDETCFDEDGNLQCQMQEHEHTDDCYKEVRELTCTLEESEGHHHTDACYEKNLICGKEVHTHSPACYEKEAADAVEAFAGYTAGTAYEVDDGSDSGDNSGGADGLHAAGYNDGSEGSGDTDGSEGAVGADASAGTDNTDLSAWEPPLLEESAAAATTNVLLPEDLQTEDLSDGYVPQLDSLYFDAVLNDHTAFYYFHPEEGEEVPANSADITSWKPVDKNTELAPTDLVKAYLAYTIPAGSLNETNQIARYRLPANIHLTDDQILAINNNENGIAAGYVDPSTNTVLDEDAVNYHKYLGAEAVEGTRRPDQDSRNAGEDGFGDAAQEYISATVKAENVFDEEGLYGEKGAYLGQDLIFVFSPYTIEKNQTTYDTAGNPTAKGEKVTGWFAVDLNMEQIDWSDPVETILPMDDENQTAAAQNHSEDQNQNLEQAQELEQGQAQDQGQETVLEQDQTTADDNIHPQESAAQITHTALQRIERTANIVFVAEGKEENNHKIHEISSELKLVQMNEIEIEDEDQPTEDMEGQAESPESDQVEDPSDEKSEADLEGTPDSADSAEGDANADADTDSALEENKEKQAEKAEPEYKDGTLEVKGNGYKITMDYKADAKIPENAYLHVTEITRESDAEAYEACLEEARKSVPSDGTRVDDKASRFFDIEILVDEPVSKENENKDLQKNTRNNTAEQNENVETEGSDSEEANSEKADSEKIDSEEAVDEKQMTTRKIEPAAPVSVNIQLFDTEISQKPDDFNAEQYKVVHIAEDKTEEIQDVKAQTIEPEKKDAESASAKKDSDSDTTAVAPATEVQFEAESFSIYGVVYTVDFHWEVNGKKFDFSMTGGDCISLTDIVEKLGIASIEDDRDKHDAAAEFVAGIESAEFSNPDLVWIGRVEKSTTVGDVKEKNNLTAKYSAELTEEQREEINARTINAGDWILISLREFDTEETLTVTMDTGEVFSIKVTDSNFASTVDGKTFALILSNQEKTGGNALQATVLNDGRMKHQWTNINYLGETVNEEVYFCDNENSIKWTFEYIKGSGNQFHLKAADGRYLHIDSNNRFSLSNEPSVFYADVKSEDNDHVRLCTDETLYNAINLFNGNNGFGIWNQGYNTDDPNEWFTICKPFNMDTNSPGTITTVDNNAEGIELKLFDYDYISTPGTTGELDKEGNKISGDNLNSTYNTSVNQGKKFWFLGWGSDSNVTTPGINDFTGLGNNIRALQGIVKNNLEGGYPVLAVDQDGNSVSSNGSLAYLFDGTAAETKSYTANHLFEKIGDKYSYDSNKHYAEFNKNTGDFTVYDGTLEQTGKRTNNNQTSWVRNDKAVGFFPFDEYSDMKGLYDNNRLYLNPDISENDQQKKNGGHYRMNHHNGMSLDAHFRLPEGGQDSYGNDIEFEYSGDDDLWVYIDDVLVLDIGGVHQPLNGKINFTTGAVHVDAAVAADGVDSTNVAGTDTTIEEMFRKAGKTYDPNKLHEMKVFWIERGGCDSNCKIEFNLPLTKTKEAGAVTFNKVSAVNQSLKLEGAVFTLYTDAACTTPLLIGNVPVTATSGADGVVNFYAIPVGDYYVKETTFPEGYAAKNPEEIFTVHVTKDTTSCPLINGSEVNPVTNEPKKISVDVEKAWENGDTIPDSASIEIILGRYKLVEDPNAQGKGTLVIKDSYTGLPMGSTYNVTYTITGPDNYSNTIRKTYSDASMNIEISVPDLPAGVQYTVTKTVGDIATYNINNKTASASVTVPKKGSADAVLTQSTFSRNAYSVTVYSMDKKTTANTWISTTYYPAGSTVYVEGTYKNEDWIKNSTFQFAFNQNGTYKDLTKYDWGNTKKGRTDSFVLDHDVSVYIRCWYIHNGTSDISSSWTQGYDWFKDPTIVGATSVSVNSAGRMMKALRAGTGANVLSVTAPAPTLPSAPKDTVYELDTDYASDPDKITLSGGTWTGKASGLDAYNEYGPYVYYIAEVRESGVPARTTVTIADEVTYEGSTKVLTVTNRLPDTASLAITKKVTVHGQAVTDKTNPSPADGEYTFEVTKKDDDTFEKRTITLTITNGVAATSQPITGLEPGTYIITELDSNNGTSVSKINDEVVEEGTFSKEITITDDQLGHGTISVSFTNNYESGNVSFTKKDSTGAALPGATFALYKSYESGNPSDPLMVNGEAVTATSGEGGIVSFNNIPVGTYYMKETEAPEGFILSPQRYRVVIGDGLSESKISKIFSSDGKVVTEIENTPTPNNPDFPPSQVENHKRIDALRDGITNPDSPHTGDDLTDLYRLYLDYKVNSVQEPEGIDLLFVLDNSGSMHFDAFSGNPNRAPTIEAMLNGSDGLISDFMELNPNNRWAAVAFNGPHGYDYNIDPLDLIYNVVWGTPLTGPYEPGEDLAPDNNSNVAIRDSKVISPGETWSKQQGNEVNVTLPKGEGEVTIGVWPLSRTIESGSTILTNYTAGLWRAEQLLKDANGNKIDNRKKIVMFISDGIPTLYIDCEGTLNNANSRPGSSYYPDQNGNGGCPDQTLAQVNAFVNDMENAGYTFGENMEFYTVGFGNSIIAESAGKTLLRNMIKAAYEGEEPTGHFLTYEDGNVSTVAARMKKELGSIVGIGESFSNIQITDNLSEYVDIVNPDKKTNSAEILRAAGAKVTMTDPANTAQTIVLYENGAITLAGSNILDSVSYENDAVTAKFKNTYEAVPGITYTLSFDVKASDKAYEEFAESGYGLAAGDFDTDYLGTTPANATSSDQPGFKSNEAASVSYTHKKNNTTETDSKNYKDPVIQVFNAPISILKTDQEGAPVSGAKFNLYNGNYDPSKPITDSANVACKLNQDALESTIESDEGGKDIAVISIEKLKPGTYYLVETETPDGYNSLDGPIKIVVNVETSVEQKEQDGDTITTTVDTVKVKVSKNGVEINQPLFASTAAGKNEWVLKVVNDSGVELPNTGGPGTRLFYLLGIMLAGIAGAGLLLRKHRSPG